LGIILAQTSNVPSGTPTWVAYTALGISIILALIKLAEAWNDYNKPSRVTFTLTRDLFFRYLEEGETLFLNAVVGATDHPAMISNLSGTLRKSDGSKSFTIIFQRFGQPTDRGNVIHDHYFFSSSPIDLIPVNTPIRRIYLCVLNEYLPQMEHASAHFRTEIARLAPGLQDALKQAAVGEQIVGSAVVDEVKQLRQEYVQAYTDAVQLEQGEYRLTVSCSYHSPHQPPRKASSASSELVFKVVEPVKVRVRAGLEPVVNSIVSQIVFGKGIPYQAPVITPTDVQVSTP
jgi:hypothetical protein